LTAAPLVVTDLDGTLWADDLVVRPRTRAAVAALEAAGVPVLAATARRVRGARELLARNGIALPVVGLNGARGALADGTPFHAMPFTRDAAIAALAAFAEHGLAPCTYVDEPGVEVVLPPEPSTNPGHVAYLRSVARSGDLAEVVRNGPVYGFSVLGRPEPPLRDLARTLDAAGIAYDLAPEPQWPGWSVNVMAPGVSKWAGVLAFCAATGASADAVLAVGDGTNDVPMLRAAARPFVVAGSRAARRVAAAETIAPPEDDGWAALAELLLS
jgi:hydroxymethylpyrimidine pyrophosphatase-like HAD family hydrolase